MATRKELLARVLKHLRKQNARSRLSDGTCAYRGSSERRCAIGALLPDSHYRDAIEGMPVCDLSDDTLTACGFDLSRPNEIRFAVALQQLHDDDAWDQGPRIDALRERYL